MNARETIKQQISSNTILLYMKGVPSAPEGGDSARVTQAVMSCGEKFTHIDVLCDPDIRAELPKYANWPNVPQLWVNGEFVGGAETIIEMFETGELQTLIKAAAAKAKQQGA
ncbi:Grx4 family monothiol glutaredoxin [Streptomyces echinatus]|uniref:Grx4 family monothiol glutaredoxin n=1 Tax=Streptomyces echinatus TaxID=67293 RepID=UPI0038035F8A